MGLSCDAAPGRSSHHRVAALIVNHWTPTSQFSPVTRHEVHPSISTLDLGPERERRPPGHLTNYEVDYLPFQALLYHRMTPPGKMSSCFGSGRFDRRTTRSSVQLYTIIRVVVFTALCLCCSEKTKKKHELIYPLCVYRKPQGNLNFCPIPNQWDKAEIPATGFKVNRLQMVG